MFNIEQIMKDMKHLNCSAQDLKLIEFVLNEIKMETDPLNRDIQTRTNSKIRELIPDET